MRRTLLPGAIMLTTGLATALGDTIAGNALRFDGNNDFATIADAPHLRFPDGNSFTMELWFASDIANPENRTLLSKRSTTGSTASGPLYQIELDATSRYKLRDADGTTVTGRPPSNPVAVGEWHHFALVRDTALGELRFFVDGGRIDTGTDPTADITPVLALRIGRNDHLGGSQYFDGLMDEIRIWNIARTDGEITSYYKRIIDDPLSEPGLVGYWNFDEGIGEQSIFDSSSSALHGFLGGSSSAGSDDPSRLPSTAPLIPEPSTVLLIGCGAVLAVRRRQH